MSLYQDIVDRIAEFSLNDFETLSNLCCASRACVPLARKRLYRELDLTTGLMPSEYRGLELLVRDHRKKQRSNEMKKEVVLKSDHLHKYIKSLVLTVIPTPLRHGEWISNSAFPWISLAVQIRENLEHVHLQIPRANFSAGSSPQLEQILASPSLKSVTLDQVLASSLALPNGPRSSASFLGHSPTFEDPEAKRQNQR
jgi:hypothetical protein